MNDSWRIVESVYQLDELRLLFKGPGHDQRQLQELFTKMDSELVTSLPEGARWQNLKDQLGRLKARSEEITNKLNGCKTREQKLLDAGSPSDDKELAALDRTISDLREQRAGIKRQVTVINQSLASNYASLVKSHQAGRANLMASLKADLLARRDKIHEKISQAIEPLMAELAFVQAAIQKVFDPYSSYMFAAPPQPSLAPPVELALVGGLEEDS